LRVKTATVERELAGPRPSADPAFGGTEPVLRVMVERPTVKVAGKKWPTALPASVGD